MDVTVVFEKSGDKYFSCFVEEDTGKCGFIGYGRTARQAEEDLLIEPEEYRSMGETDVPDIVIKRRKFDIGSFFDYYPINITQFAKFAKINASQLRQYVSNKRNPSRKTEAQIMDAVRNLGKIFVNDDCAIGIN